MIVETLTTKTIITHGGLTQGEQMLIDMGYEIVENSEDVTFFKQGDYVIEIYKKNRFVTVSEEESYYRCLQIAEIQAIHQCMIDYGWVESRCIDE